MNLLDGINDTKDELYTFDSIMETKTTSEGLKALKDIKQLLSLNQYGDKKDKQVVNDELYTIEKELKRLEEIDNVMFLNNKKLKALEIIKEKKVWVVYLSKCDTCEDYNHGTFDFGKENYLTQEEFDFLKKVML